MSVPIGQTTPTAPIQDPIARPATRSGTRRDQAADRAAEARDPRSVDPVAATDGSGVERASRHQVRAELDRNDQIAFGERRIEFAFDEDADRVVVKIRDAASDEIVRQLPPDDFLKFIARFREQIGILFDEQA